MIVLENTPNIPGLAFRHFQGERDYAPIAAVLTASESADQSVRQVSAGEIARAYQHLERCDPFKDLVIAEVAGEMIGYARGWWEENENLERAYHHNGFLLPNWRRKGIGSAMLRWLEAHFREAPQSGGAKYFQTNATQFQAGRSAMLEACGYQPVRYFYEMVCPTLDDIVEFPLPAGLEFRPVTSDQYPAIWESVDETSKDEWGYTRPGEDDYQDWLASPHFQPRLWQAAWEIATDKLVGHCLTFIDDEENKQFNRKRGYTEGIGVERAWRRRGVARAMISRSLQAQKAAGMTESALVADSDSTSNVIQLYESCGFRVVKRDTIYRKPF
jgi:ribosomal protein S18 acetylase RimI-like enzyme